MDLKDLPATFGMSAKEELYRVKVMVRDQAIQVNGRSVRLLPGMMVEADVRHETRKVIEWVIDPMRALSKSLY